MIDDYTANALRDLIRQAKKNNPHCSSYSKLNKQGLYDLAKKLGLVDIKSSPPTLPPRVKKEETALNRIARLIQIVQASQMSPSAKNKALQKLGNLYNNWKGTKGQIDLLLKYEKGVDMS